MSCEDYMIVTPEESCWGYPGLEEAMEKEEKEFEKLHKTSVKIKSESSEE